MSQEWGGGEREREEEKALGLALRYHKRKTSKEYKLAVCIHARFKKIDAGKRLQKTSFHARGVTHSCLRHDHMYAHTHKYICIYM